MMMMMMMNDDDDDDIGGVHKNIVHLDVLSLRPQTNTTSASAPLRGSLLAASAARFGPSALKVRSFWMD